MEKRIEEEEAACKQHDEEVARLESLAQELKIEKERLKVEARAMAKVRVEREAEHKARIDREA